MLKSRLQKLDGLTHKILKENIINVIRGIPKRGIPKRGIPKRGIPKRKV